MKKIFLLFTLSVSIFLSSCYYWKDDIILDNDNNKALSYDQAQKEEFILFTLEDLHEVNGQDQLRVVELTGENFQVKKYTNHLIAQQDLKIDKQKEALVVREVKIVFPSELSSLNYHWEVLEMAFSNVVDINEVTGPEYEKQYVSNQKFVSSFLKLGSQDKSLVNFGFIQSYLWTTANDERKLVIDKIQKIKDKENMILVSGHFSGVLDHQGQANFYIKNGKFNMILEN